MSKEELQNKIENLEKQLVELKREINPIKDEEAKKGVRQMPKYGEKYFYLDSNGYIYSENWIYDTVDLFRFNTGNCFKTEKEAEEYKENLLTKQALKDLALELNNGVEIDWEDASQQKFSLYGECHCFLHQEFVVSYADIGQVYCLDSDFLRFAVTRIGEERLIKLIKSGV